jgi:hypothetical protein
MDCTASLPSIISKTAMSPPFEAINSAMLLPIPWAPPVTIVSVFFIKKPHWARDYGLLAIGNPLNFYTAS